MIRFSKRTTNVLAAGLGWSFALVLAGSLPCQRQHPQLQRFKIAKRFDRDGDQRLSEQERAAARKWMREERERTRGGQALLRHGAPLSLADRGDFDAKQDTAHRGKASWFAPDVLRTVYLEFAGEDWHGELADFYRTDVAVPATLWVDGMHYKGVGVRYRGSSSYLMVRGNRKKSFNIAIDDTDDSLRVYGNRTLNLLNCNQDSSSIRDAVFAQVAGRFVPTLRVNFVRLVVNGVDWGIYANAQQFNRDFLKDWYGSRKGVRWKIERNYGGRGALTYLGADRSAYEGVYELKTTVNPERDAAAWERLLAFLKLLNETPPKDLPKTLPKILDVDRTLWFLALEWVFQDNDGYVRQGYDYRLLEDRYGRFLPILYDNNEILPARQVRSSRMGQVAFGTDPLQHWGNLERPLMTRLLEVPEYQARYLAYVRTVVAECLDWAKLGPVCTKFHQQIAPFVEKDSRRLMSIESFRRSIDELKRLAGARRSAILADSNMAGPWPEIAPLAVDTVVGKDPSRRRMRVTMRAKMVDAPKGQDAGVVDTAWLYYRTSAKKGFLKVAMKRGADGSFLGLTPAFALGTKVDYYAEARAVPTTCTTAFLPAAAEAAPAQLTIRR